MNIKIKGIVLSQRTFRPREKYLTLLTDGRGLLEVRLRVFGQITTNSFSNIGVMGYYYFDLFDGKSGFVVDAAEPIETFFDLRYDPVKLALAQYFCELTQFMVPPLQNAGENLRFLLNTLYLLKEDARNQQLLKAVFEFRILRLCGFLPNLICCVRCCQYEGTQMYYLPLRSQLICSDCLKKEPHCTVVPLPKPVLHAMRFILYKDSSDVFQFQLDDKSLQYLGRLSEYCILIHTDRPLKSLEIYKQLTKSLLEN